MMTFGDVQARADADGTFGVAAQELGRGGMANAAKQPSHASHTSTCVQRQPTAKKTVGRI